MAADQMRDNQYHNKDTLAYIHLAGGRLTARSREVSKPQVGFRRFESL